MMQSAFGRSVLRIAVILCVAWGAHLALSWANAQVETGGLGMRLGMLALFLAVYSVLIAIPFVPGVEIGLSLMAIEGPWIAPLIYLATLGGLSLAYAAGAWMPYDRLRRILADLRLRRAAQLLESLQPLDRPTRLDLLRTNTPRRLRPLVTRYRYVLLALLVNLPGNALIGGGGGIVFIAGCSRLFGPLPTLATLALAVAPVPLLVWGFGIDVRHLFR